MPLANPPENSLQEVSERPYGYEEYRKQKGNGSNLLRTNRVAQPRALRKEDTLANGDRVLATPRGGYNGSVWVLLSGGLHGHWVEMPARIPIALLTETDEIPDTLVEDMQD